VAASSFAAFGPRGLGSWGPRDAAPATAAPYDVEDLASAFCRLGNGTTLILEASWAQWVDHDLAFVDVYGTEAGAHLEWGAPANGDAGHLTIMTDVKGHPALITPEIPPSGGHGACIADFVRAVRGGTRPVPGADLLVNRAVIIDAAYASAEQRREIVLA
jgi:predicted dehydrogenase